MDKKISILVFLLNSYLSIKGSKCFLPIENDFRDRDEVEIFTIFDTGRIALTGRNAYYVFYTINTKIKEIRFQNFFNILKNLM